MFSWFKKISIGIKLFALLFLVVTGCVSLGVFEVSKGDGSQLPVRRLDIKLDKNQRDIFFDRLRAFAEAHAFKFILTDYGSGDDYQAEILGDHIKILAVILRHEPERVFIGFYGRYSEEPPPNEEIIVDLVDDLKSFISEIPNITITEE